MDNEEILELVESLRNMMLDQATGTASSQKEYGEARTLLLETEAIKPLLPRWVRVHRTLSSFEQYMKAEYPTYAARRGAIKEAFEPILAKLNGEYVVPMDTLVAEAVDNLDIEHIQTTWQRALARIKGEPDAAITSARTLLESVCKSILEQDGLTERDYKDFNLKQLFNKAWEILDKNERRKPLEDIQIKLGELIEKLGTLRNKYGDAHGRGPDYSPPTQVEAEFAVNIAGTIALLLIRRWKT